MLICDKCGMRNDRTTKSIEGYILRLAPVRGCLIDLERRIDLCLPCRGRLIDGLIALVEPLPVS